MAEPVIQLLAELIAVDTANPPGNEAAAARLLADWLTSAGLESAIIPVEDQRANVVTRLRGERSRPAMLWLGHLDTVPAGNGWAYPPCKPTVRDGLLIGRGASDMKGGVAAMAVAAVQLAHSNVRLKQDLYLYFTSDEEVGGLGVQRLLAEPFMKDVGAIVVGEPTNLQLGICEKGALWLEITTQGRSAHGSAPELGVNAIEHMMRVLFELSRLKLGVTKHALLGRDTCSIGTIHGGSRTNVVPDTCQLTLDYRFLPGQNPEEFIQTIKSMLDGLQQQATSFSATTRVIALRPAFATPQNSPVVQAALAAGTEALGSTPPFFGVNYFTDATAVVTATGLPAIVFGPGDPAQMHAPDEAISLDKLRAAVSFYTLLAQKRL